MALEIEREHYEKIRGELLQRHRNFFVLIKGRELIGVFPDAETAYREGINRFGLESFLVKQVLESEPTAVAPAFSVTVPRARL